MDIKNSIRQVSNIRKNISDFINSQNIIGTISGVTIAVSAGNTIRSFVNEIIFPTFYYIFRNNIKSTEFTPISYEHISVFFKEFITFLFVLVLTFYFVKNVMAQLFDLKLPSAGTANAGTANAGTANAAAANNRRVIAAGADISAYSK